MSGIIEIKKLSFSYTSDRKVLKNISFDVKQGTFLAIAGPNGAGKSTLLNLICGALKADKGRIKIDGAPVGSYSAKNLAKKVAIVRQEIVTAFGFSVVEVVLMARTLYYNQIGFESEVDRQIVHDALEATDMAKFTERTLGSLSGGERRRVFIARALAQDCPIILLDEPTNFLDIKYQVGIYDLLKVAQVEKGKTIVAITHDINLAAQYCDEILLFAADGSCQFGRPEEILIPEQIKKNFGVRVFSGKIGRKNFFIPLGKFAKYNDSEAELKEK